jgi:hypothetical protein
LSSHTNTVKYTEPARCVYSNETGCEKQVVWYTGGGLCLPLDADTKERHDCRTPVKRIRIPNREIEPEEYLRYINAQKDSEWAEFIGQDRKQYVTLATEQPASVTTAPKQKRYVTTECPYCKQDVNYESDGYSSISGGLKENTKGPALDLDSEIIHDCLEGVNERNVQILNTKIKFLEDRIQQQEKAYERRVKNLEQYIGRAFF